MSETKLLPCPMCGHKARFDMQRGEFKSGAFVYCTRKGCGLRTRIFLTIALAAQNWNTRTPDPRNAAAQGLADALKVVVSHGEPLRANDELWTSWRTRVNAWTAASAALAAWEKAQ